MQTDLPGGFHGAKGGLLKEETEDLPKARPGTGVPWRRGRAPGEAPQGLVRGRWLPCRQPWGAGGALHAPGAAIGRDWRCRCWGASHPHRPTPRYGPTRYSPPWLRRAGPRRSRRALLEPSSTAHAHFRPTSHHFRQPSPLSVQQPVLASPAPLRTRAAAHLVCPVESGCLPLPRMRAAKRSIIPPLPVA